MGKKIIKSIEIEVGGKTLKLSPEEVKELKKGLDELTECDKQHFQPYYVPYYQPTYVPQPTWTWRPSWTATGTGDLLSIRNTTTNVLRIQ